MSVTDSDIAFVKELLEGLGPLTHRNMMGGATFYSEGQVFAILSSDGEIFLKAKGAFAEAMEAEGSRIFGMDGKTMGYWTMPEAALDDPDLACEWARRALAALA
ncbi:TfoX/Sxy family protein [Aliiroseovarius sp. 2305UL8-7]|uniref:TfoX/Sxy family protein n=1 Tax=Aliiroseovarius conchicola TaxID=3121637 RepID=UPI0035286E1E